MLALKIANPGSPDLDRHPCYCYKHKYLYMYVFYRKQVRRERNAAPVVKGSGSVALFTDVLIARYTYNLFKTYFIN